MMGRDVINEPFAVINADDYYGRESFKILADFLTSVEGKQNEYCMVGYRLCNTLSEGGTVARGICETDANGFLTKVTERTAIQRDSDGLVKFIEGDVKTVVEENVPVSMNMWGFTPDYFKYSDDYFAEFLKENISNPKCEFFIPLMVDRLIHSHTATCRVLDTPSKWFGVTYASDRQSVVDKFQALADNGTYPSPLF
jgi:hypothetical protein